MVEGTPSTPPEQIRQLNRSLTEKVLDKAASDSEWKQRLLDDPEATMVEAGFSKARLLQEMQASMKSQGEAEVMDQFYNDRSSCLSQPQYEAFSLHKRQEPTYK